MHLAMLLLHQGSDIRKHETRVERAGTVDVPDAALAVDQEHAQGMIERSPGGGRIRFPIHRLAVMGEDGLQFRLGAGG